MVTPLCIKTDVLPGLKHVPKLITDVIKELNPS